MVALTLDDGPDPETTGPILDLLRRHRARATFFVITGHVDDPALLRRLVAEGHELGNHGTLDRPHVRLPLAEFDLELRTAQTALTRFGPVDWFRPGGGIASPTMIERAEGLGLRPALGDVFPFDTQLGFVPWIVWYVTGAVRPGSIVVLHERGGRGRRTLAALERILPRLTARGYRVTTLSGGAGIAAAAAPSESSRSK